MYCYACYTSSTTRQLTHDTALKCHPYLPDPLCSLTSVHLQGRDSRHRLEQRAPCLDTQLEHLVAGKALVDHKTSARLALVRRLQISARSQLLLSLLDFVVESSLVYWGFPLFMLASLVYGGFTASRTSAFSPRCGHHLRQWRRTVQCQLAVVPMVQLPPT